MARFAGLHCHRVRSRTENEKSRAAGTTDRLSHSVWSVPHPAAHAWARRKNTGGHYQSAEQAARSKDAHHKLQDVGAHYVVDTLDDVFPKMDARIEYGDRPQRGARLIMVGDCNGLPLRLHEG